MSSGRESVCAATRSSNSGAVVRDPSSASVRVRRRAPNSSSPTLASVTPSVWKQICERPGIETTVWRVPVRAPAPIGGAEQTVIGSIAREPSTIGGG